MKIAALVPIYQPGPGVPKLTAPREIYKIDKFAVAVGQAAGISVSVVEGSLADAPADGFVLLFDSFQIGNYPAVARRAIQINADRISVREDLERYQFVGAIERHRYFLWCAQPETEDGRGVFGLKDLAPAIGAHVSEGPFTTANYSLFVTNHFRDLPSLLAAYLAEVERVRGAA